MQIILSLKFIFNVNIYMSNKLYFYFNAKTELSSLSVFVKLHLFYFFLNILLIKKAEVPAIDCMTIIDLTVESEIFPVDAVIRIDLAVELIKESIKYRE